MTAGQFGHDDYVITVGPGTYALANDVTISGEGVTLESSEGLADTKVDCNDNATSTRRGFIITGDESTITGFTLDDSATAVSIQAEDVVVTGLKITDANVAGVEVQDTGINATVSDNVIEDCATGILFTAPSGVAVVDMDDVDVKNNEITEANTNGAIVFEGGNKDIDITGNTITDNEVSGIYFEDGSTFVSTDIDIKDNTITLNEGHGIEFFEDTDTPTDIVITGNDISANEDDGIYIVTWDDVDSYLMFNDIYDNDDDAVENEQAVDVSAYLNWWGSADEDDFEDEIVGDVEYEPWLMGTAASETSGFKASAGNATSLDAKDACGVGVTGIEDDTLIPLQALMISAAQYAANPEDEIADAIAFYDVLIILEANFDITDINGKIKFYDSAITSGSTANFWTGDFWAECSDQEARNGIIYVTVSDDTLPALDELEETKFAVVAGEAEDALESPEVLAPEVGDTEVALQPTCAWSAVSGADGYYFQLADNANFVMPMVDSTGDLMRLVVTAYAHRAALDYATPYYWRVKAVSGTELAGDLEESAWVAGVFTTIEEPVAVEEAEPAPPVIEPIVEVTVPLPAQEQITPAWIYVIIGVGALLVIAVIVLIVRTRRVA